MSQPTHLRCIVLLACATLAQGCVTVHAPLQRDQDYPASWPGISALGPECKAIAGTYENSGVLAIPHGTTQPVSLMSVLNLQGTAKTVSLSARTRKVDRNGDTFATLEVVPDGNPAARQEFANCFCIKQTLACTQLAETYWSVPNFGAGGSQKNVYFSLARDKSLVARLQNYRLDVLLAFPVFGKTEPWALFTNAGQ